MQNGSRDDLSSIVDKLDNVGDAAAIVVLLGSLSSILPGIASFLTVIWLALRIWESDTIREITGRATRGGGDE
jgi:hypothetical protein